MYLGDFSHNCVLPGQCVWTRAPLEFLHVFRDGQPAMPPWDLEERIAVKGRRLRLMLRMSASRRSFLDIPTSWHG